MTSNYGTPTGSVSFTDNGVKLSTLPLVSGEATQPYTGATIGTHTITATYIPTGAFAPSSAFCYETVNYAPTTSTLTVTPTSAAYGSPIQLKATVAPSTPPGSGTPAGTVTFFSGSTNLGTATLAGGVASFSATTIPAGADTLTCSYSGSNTYSPSNCNSLPVTIQAAPTVLTVTSSNNPAAITSKITLTAQLNLSNGQPAGSGNAIQITIHGQTNTFITASNGAITFPFSEPNSGSYPITATFAGNNNLQPSSAALTETILPANTSTTLTAAPNPGNQNQKITLTATVVSPASFAPDGSIAFYDGPTRLGLGAIQSTSPNFVATYTSTFAVGTHNLTAQYPGNSNFNPSTSPVYQESILAGDFSITATPAAATLYTGQSTTATVTVTAINGLNLPVNLTCANLPVNTNCSFTPTTLSNGQGSSTLTIQTTAPQKTTSSTNATTPAAGLALGAVTLLLLPASKTRRRILARLALLLLAAASITGITACGAPTPITGGTPQGTYQIAITGTVPSETPALSHATTFTLTVKSLF